MRKEVNFLKKKKAKLIFVIAFFLIFALIASLLVFFFSLNRDIDLSLIKTGGTSITRIYYFDYEDREKRIGKAVELEDEAIFLQKSEWCSLYDMPKNLYNAFIAIEDKRFYEHMGVDFLRTGKAVLNYVFGKEKQKFGGSTITQQLIKNLTGDNEGTPKRKIEEILRALQLETKLSKNEILETYLNVVYLSQNCYGVRMGADIYFNKDIEELTLAECASLAAIVKSPTNYNPYNNALNNYRRRKIVLKEMLNQGYITEVEYNDAINEDVIINSNIENENKSGVYSWYTETLINDVSKDLARKNKITIEAAKRMILKGGLNIYSTIDPRLQQAVEKVYEGYKMHILPQNGIYPQSSCVILDPKTSDILAVVGGIGKKDSNMIFNRAISAKRPPGSTIKPLSVYAPAIEKGIINYSTVYDDTPVKKVNDSFWPKNSPNKYRGLMPICYAVEHSVNTVAVKVLEDLGISNSIKFLDSLSINVDKELDNNASSLALGQLTNGETVLNLTNAYTTFANGGSVSKPRSYLYVTDNYGNVILENNSTSKKVLSNDSSAIITKMLQNVVKKGTASSVKLNNTNIEIAGKTGTSSNNEDRWFVGYTPDYVCGIWTGFDTPKPINSAINPSCSLFNAIFNSIYLNEDEVSEFKVPDTIIEKDFCFDSGALPSDLCDNDMRGVRTVKGYFTKENMPNELCQKHQSIIIDTRDGLESKGLASLLYKQRVVILNHERENIENVNVLDDEYLLKSKIRS